MEVYFVKNFSKILLFGLSCTLSFTLPQLNTNYWHGITKFLCMKCIPATKLFKKFNTVSAKLLGIQYGYPVDSELFVDSAKEEIFREKGKVASCWWQNESSSVAVLLMSSQSVWVMPSGIHRFDTKQGLPTGRIVWAKPVKVICPQNSSSQCFEVNFDFSWASSENSATGESSVGCLASPGRVPCPQAETHSDWTTLRGLWGEWGESVVSCVDFMSRQLL